MKHVCEIERLFNIYMRRDQVKRKFSFMRPRNIANYFEVAFAVMILIIVIIRAVEVFALLFGYQIIILKMGFEEILSMALTLIIGVEFTKMLFSHTPESVIDVLLFAIARQAVLYHEKPTDMLLGIVAIAGLFAVKKFLVIRNLEKTSVTGTGTDNETGADKNTGSNPDDEA